MKAVLISIHPEWVAKILNGEKKIEVRKTRPKVKTPFKCYIYCTKKMRLWGKIMGVTLHLNAKVVGEFVCDNIYTYEPQVIACAKFETNGAMVVEHRRYNAGACMDAEEMFYYSKGKTLYGWHISDLKIYDEPKELSDFKTRTLCPQAQYSERFDVWYCEDGYTNSAITDNTRDFPYNEECIYFDCPRVGGDNDEYEDCAYCTCNGHKMLTRPPQSWCYVKESRSNL